MAASESVAFVVDNFAFSAGSPWSWCHEHSGWRPLRASCLGSASLPLQRVKTTSRCRCHRESSDAIPDAALESINHDRMLDLGREDDVQEDLSRVPTRTLKLVSARELPCRRQNFNRGSRRRSASENGKSERPVMLADGSDNETSTSLSIKKIHFGEASSGALA